MYKVAIWGGGDYYNRYFQLLMNQVEKEEIEVIGIFVKNPMYTYIDGYKIYESNLLKSMEFDYCICAMENASSIQAEAREYGIQDIIINIKVFSFPYFSFDRYVRIYNSKMTLLTRNCFAGLLYNQLGMKFYSPTINLLFSDEDFNKFAENYSSYLLYDMKDITNLANGYDCPKGQLDNIVINFIHYATYKEAEAKWKERTSRITDEVVLVSFTENIDVVEQFDKINIKKKIIFCPFETSFKSAFYLKRVEGEAYYITVNKIAEGRSPVIDILAFLDNQEYCRVRS